MTFFHHGGLEIDLERVILFFFKRKNYIKLSEHLMDRGCWNFVQKILEDVFFNSSHVDIIGLGSILKGMKKGMQLL